MRLDVLDRPQRVRPFRLLEDDDFVAPRLKVLNEPTVVGVSTGSRKVP